MGAYDTEISKALQAHGMWKVRLKTGIELGRLEVPAADVAKDNLCDFGRWLADAETDPGLSGLAEFRKVVDLHREFHGVAGGIAGHIEAGDKASAVAELEGGTFDDLSGRLGAALMALKRAS